jgi:uncharacterized protein YhaN
MRIHELRLIRYGAFTDRTLVLPHAERDIHLIVGPNEAGKSTVRAAITDWLFGIPVRTPKAFLHPMPELRLGGVLERRDPAGEGTERLAFDRTKGHKHTLRTPDDQVLPDHALRPWLGSLEATSFSQMHALDHASLIEGGDGILSAADDIGRMLFQSAAGIEHLDTVWQQLQADADRLWAPRRAGKRLYYQALDAYEAAHSHFKQATLRTRDWKAQHDALAAALAQLEQAKARGVALRSRLSALERIRRVRPLLLALDAAKAQREALLAAGDVPLLDAHASQQLATATQAMALAQAEMARLARDIEQAQALVHGTPLDRALLALDADITELNERRLQFRAHRTDLLKRAEEVRMEWGRVQAMARDLGWPSDHEDTVAQRLPAAPARARLAQLIHDRVVLQQQLHTQRTQLAQLEQQFQQAEEALRSLSSGAVPPALAIAVEEALRLGDQPARMAELQQTCDDLDHQLEADMAALGPWRPTLEGLRAMVAPDPMALRDRLAQHKADAAEAHRLHDALASKALELDQLEGALQAFVRHFQPVSREQVEQARSSRDASWRALRQAPHALAAQAAAFEGQIAQADQLADQRLERAQYEAERQSKLDALAQKRREHLDLQQRGQAHAQQMAQRHNEWTELCHACALPSLPLEAAPAWLERRQRVLDAALERAKLQRRLAAEQAEAARLRDTLWALLAGDHPTEPAPALKPCLRLAQDQLTQAAQAQGQRTTWEQRLHEGHLGRAPLRASLASAQHDWEAWQQAWQQAAVLAGYEATVSVEQVEAEIQGMQEIDQLLDRIRRIRSERIDTMQADLEGLAATAHHLAERVAPDLLQLPPEDIALTLLARLNEARRAAAALADSQDRLQRSQAAWRQAQEGLQAVHARLAPLMAAAGVDEVSALGPAIERSDQRRAIESHLEAIERDIALAADGLSQAQLRTEAHGIGPDALKAEWDQLQAESTTVLEQIADLSRACGTHKAALDTWVGAGQAAQAEAQRQEAMAAMTEAAERYLELQTASRLLQWALERFRETRQGPMLARASAIFSGLTLGGFSRLSVDASAAAPRLSGIRPSGMSVDVAGMSEGTRDQLYLALRLAALELQVDQGWAMPLIADDLFVNFDDRRTAAGLAVLGDLSRRMQIVCLTHHEHLVPLAREVLGPSLNVIALSP